MSERSTDETDNGNFTGEGTTQPSATQDLVARLRDVKAWLGAISISHEPRWTRGGGNQERRAWARQTIAEAIEAINGEGEQR